MLTAGSIIYGYDNNGNLIVKTLDSDVTEYSRDFNNMLTQVVSATDTYGYEYDGLENRVSRVKNSSEKRYLPGMLGETDSSGNITVYYVYGLGLISMVSATNEFYYYHYDGTGNTVLITDSLGNAVNKYVYDEFGNLLEAEEAIPNAFRFGGAGGFTDENNGVVYMQGAYYDPITGRFISKDPIGLAGGDGNLYAYMHSVGKPRFSLNPNAFGKGIVNVLYRQRKLITITFLIRGVFILGQENDDGSIAWGLAVLDDKGNWIVVPYWGKFEEEKLCL